jgi:hypothetical protein
MSRMVRKQIYIEPEQEKILKRRARELGVTESDVIRRGIEQVGRAGTGLPVDYTAWKEARRFIKERMAIDAPQTGRGWTREELHDES